MFINPNFSKFNQNTFAHDDNTFFTIVIPTRDRQDTLMYAISSALSQEYSNFEVLISDNASIDQTCEMVHSVNDPRLRYVRTSKRVSMSKNWEFALNHVRDGWVTVLGDDDGILPGSLRLVDKIIKETGTSAIRSNGCSYYWPGINQSRYGTLCTSLRKGYEIRNSGKWLQKVLDGMADYTELPMLYNGGFISTSLIVTAKRKTENLFLSMTPDVYSAIVFSLLTQDFVYSREPLSINGASVHSGGTAFFEKKKVIRAYDPAEKFYSEENIPFHPSLPLTKVGRPVRSIPIIIYEAYLQAKPFHDLKNIRSSAFRQILLAIVKSGAHHQEVIKWAEEFAGKNNVVMPNSYSLFVISAMVVFLQLSSKIAKALSSLCVRGRENFPIKNVFEATLVAGFAKEYHPGPLLRIFQRISLRMQDLK